MVQFKSRVEEEIAGLKSELRMQIADFQNQCQAEVKSEVEKVLPTAVEKGLRDLPFEMVCAYRAGWAAANSIVTYDRISFEFNNSDRPGGLYVQIYSHSINDYNIVTGADGTMNIETGVFTTVTSGFYIVTYSASVGVYAGESTNMYLHHNGVQLEESRFYTSSSFYLFFFIYFIFFFKLKKKVLHFE